jgi:hypothetical protein
MNTVGVPGNGAEPKQLSVGGPAGNGSNPLAGSDVFKEHIG